MRTITALAVAGLLCTSLQAAAEPRERTHQPPTHGGLVQAPREGRPAFAGSHYQRPPARGWRAPNAHRDHHQRWGHRPPPARATHARPRGYAPPNAPYYARHGAYRQPPPAHHRGNWAYGGRGPATGYYPPPPPHRHTRHCGH